MGKSALLNKIHGAAVIYKQFFLGKTFLVVFDKDKYIEVIFKRSSFLHLTGVSTKLSADNFFNHALTPKGLKTSEFYFDKKHPYDLAEKKISHLSCISNLLTKDSFIITDISTLTNNFKMGITELKMLICFGDDTDKAGNVIPNHLVPYSLRIEEIDNSKYDDIFEVNCVLSKDTGTKYYNTILFGKEFYEKGLSEEIGSKIMMAK